MNEYTLIHKSREFLDFAELSLYDKNHEGYCKCMSKLLYLLERELVGAAPETQNSKLETQNL